MSYSNDSFVAPDREGDEDDNAVVTNMAGDEPPLQERVFINQQDTQEIVVDGELVIREYDPDENAKISPFKKTATIVHKP